MKLPDTFACGRFNLPLIVAKIARLAASSESERGNANIKLKKHGYFVDRVGVIWDCDKIPDFAKDEVCNHDKATK